MSEKLGIYLHIPFCRRKCDYCDFYSLAGREDRMDDYLKALLAHIRETAPMARDCQVDTIYLGGGTPSLFGEKRLKILLAGVQKRFDVSRDAEITVECNPDSVDKRRLLALRHCGVNRISLGVQSACDRELAALGRIHTFHQVQAAVAAVRAVKIRSLGLDLIYGLPGQGMESWQHTVEEALALKPEHLSCYGLKVESGTPLDRRVMRGEQLPDDDLQADMYLWMVDRLAKACQEKSIYSYDVAVGPEDKILTLSTCTVKYGAQDNSHRFVVMARLLPEGAESPATARINAGGPAEPEEPAGPSGPAA